MKVKREVATEIRIKVAERSESSKRCVCGGGASKDVRAKAP